MAKKVVATLKKEGGQKFVRVIRAVKSPKSGAYAFKDEIVTEQEAKNAFK